MDTFRIYEGHLFNKDSLVYHYKNEEENTIELFMIEKKHFFGNIIEQPFKCTKLTFDMENAHFVERFLYVNDTEYDIEYDFATTKTDEVSLEDITNHLLFVTENAQQLNNGFDKLLELNIDEHITKHTFEKMKIQDQLNGLINHLLNNAFKSNSENTSIKNLMKQVAQNSDNTISSFIKNENQYWFSLHDESELPDIKRNEEVSKLLKHNNFEKLLSYIDKDIFQNTLRTITNLKQFSNFEFPDDNLSITEKQKILSQCLQATSQYEIEKQFDLKIKPLVQNYISENFIKILENKQELENENKVIKSNKYEMR